MTENPTRPFAGGGAGSVIPDRKLHWACETYRRPGSSASPPAHLRLARRSEPPPHTRLRRLGERPSAGVPEVRLWRLPHRIHSLGAGRLYEFFAELENGAELQDALERFAAIAVYHDFSRGNNGDWQ
jgi:hypothetical protein